MRDIQGENEKKKKNLYVLCMVVCALVFVLYNKNVMRNLMDQKTSTNTFQKRYMMKTSVYI